MMVAAEIGDAGGCSFQDKRDVPLSRWLGIFGFLLASLNATAIAMGFYMVRSVAPRDLDVRAGDLHSLDVVFISLVIPSFAFMLVFFVVGNVWFFWFDGKTAFVGPNTLSCQSAVGFGLAAITLIWTSSLFCGCCTAYYVNEAKKDDLREFKRLLEDGGEEEEADGEFGRV